RASRPPQRSSRSATNLDGGDSMTDFSNRRTAESLAELRRVLVNPEEPSTTRCGAAMMALALFPRCGNERAVSTLGGAGTSFCVREPHKLGPAPGREPRPRVMPGFDIDPLPAASLVQVAELAGGVLEKIARDPDANPADRTGALLELLSVHEAYVAL